MSGVFLTGADLLVNGGWQAGQGVLIEGRTIAGVLDQDASVPADRVRLPPGSLLAPGLVDIQVNGGGGILFNETPTAEAARAIADAHRRLGTTAILPTLITDTGTAMQQAALAVVGLSDHGVLGIHFEGPFLSPARPGVHAARLIRAPQESDLRLIEQLARRLDGAVLLTLAPEMVSDATLRRLAEAGVILSAGHSEASYERTMDAIAAGVRGFTHLFNAMPGPVARAPGIAAAALLDGASWCGVIADGVHVHPALLRLLLAARPGRVMLVSDAMPPVGTDAGSFTLQGRTILRGHGRLTTEDGTLAGADICLADAVRTVVRQLGLSSAQALTMAAEWPATFLGLQNRVGRIAAGCRADLLLLTPGLDVLGTWLGGRFQGEPGVMPVLAAA